MKSFIDTKSIKSAVSSTKIAQNIIDITTKKVNQINQCLPVQHQNPNFSIAPPTATTLSSKHAKLALMSYKQTPSIRFPSNVNHNGHPAQQVMVFKDIEKEMESFKLVALVYKLLRIHQRDASMSAHHINTYRSEPQFEAFVLSHKSINYAPQNMVRSTINFLAKNGVIATVQAPSPYASSEAIVVGVNPQFLASENGPVNFVEFVLYLYILSLFILGNTSK